MKVIIAEKPDYAKTITEALRTNGEKFTRCDGYFESSNYYVTWQFGHLFELYTIEEYENREDKKWDESILPYIPRPFKFRLKKDPGVRKQFQIIRNLINDNKVNEIIEAGDADEEGDLLIKLVVSYIFRRDKLNKKRSRLWSTDQTTTTILESLHNLKDVDTYKSYSNSAYTRTCMDFLLGINLTRKFTLMNSRITGSRDIFSIGRCNTCIVDFIYQRDMEIAKFKPEKYVQLESAEETNGEIIKLVDEEKYSIENIEECKLIAQKLNSNKAVVKDIQSKEIKKLPPKLFSLTELQGTLSRRYKIGMEESLDIIQKLYESGYVTYPRTNSEYLSTEEIPKIKRVIKAHSNENIHLQLKETKRIFNNEAIESHSALIVTDKVPDISKFNKNEKIIYETIRNRFISNFLVDETIMNQTVITIGIANKEYKLKGEVIVKKGFFEFEPLPKSKETNRLPNLNKGDFINIDFRPIEKQTSPPKKLTVETLVKLLKNPLNKEYEDESLKIEDMKKGISIGTDATRTGLIKNIKKYGYVTDNKGVLSITNKGIYLIENLKKLNINMTKDKTVEFSKILKRVFNGEIDPMSAIKITEDELKTMFYSIGSSTDIKGYGKKVEKESIGCCPRCGRKVFEGKSNFYCEGGLDKDNPCKFSLFKEDKFFTSKGKHISKTTAKKLLKEGKVKMKGLHKKDNSGTYDAIIEMVLTDKYVNFKLQFPNKK
ncbi:DNA topoisomerase [Clostridium thermobutyricum]|uniref:DNA topoisomerase n=1 Tax=Clostridium thermobutyricum TaxID=29372 RepID=UPI0018AA2098|nr:DNA topoisomerase [Clostridium thermobutyricum]